MGRPIITQLSNQRWGQPPLVAMHECRLTHHCYSWKSLHRVKKNTRYGKRGGLAMKIKYYLARDDEEFDENK